MSNLSRAIQKYYSRDGSRFVFRNGQSLNHLALSMWEHLGFQQVDASVLSRVLKGERLLTSPQLKAFCRLLDLSRHEEDYLFACLQQDCDLRLGVHTSMMRITHSLAKEFVEEMRLQQMHLKLFTTADTMR